MAEECPKCGNGLTEVFKKKLFLSGISGSGAYSYGGIFMFRYVGLFLCDSCEKYFYTKGDPEYIRAKPLHKNRD